MTGGAFIRSERRGDSAPASAHLPIHHVIKIAHGLVLLVFVQVAAKISIWKKMKL